jgi:hypothetical protein
MNSNQDVELKFYSKYEYVKSLKNRFNLTDEEANSFLWILEMWDRKKYIDPPSEFILMND